MSNMIDYEALVDNAMRLVLLEILREAEGRQRFPGEHYLHITFLTQYNGVIISNALKTRYPEEMTIALQHQFRKLSVYSDRFEVNLSFTGSEERLSIPFAAIVDFSDPSTHFSVRMHPDINDSRGKFKEMITINEMIKKHQEEEIKDDDKIIYFADIKDKLRKG